MDLQQGIHYAVPPDSFILTTTGIKKASELRPSDGLLGIERGKPSFRELKQSHSHKMGRWIRILADCCECLVMAESAIFTVQGATGARDITIDETIEIMNLPSQALSNLEKLPVMTIFDFELTPQLAYLLGTQLFARRFPDHVLIDETDPSIARDLAKEFGETLNDQGVRHKIYFPRYGGRLRIDSYILANFVHRFLGDGDRVPYELRTSTPEVMRHFLCGVLDSAIKESHHQEGQVKFRTFLKQSEYRRFLFQLLRLYHLQSASTKIHYPTDEMAYVETYLRLIDLEQLGLRFFRIQPGPIKEGKEEPFFYTKVIDVQQLQGSGIVLDVGDAGWTLDCDLVLVKRC
jgi:hypothetical protein